MSEPAAGTFFGTKPIEIQRVCKLCDAIVATTAQATHLDWHVVNRLHGYDCKQAHRDLTQRNAEWHIPNEACTCGLVDATDSMRTRLGKAKHKAFTGHEMTGDGQCCIDARRAKRESHANEGATSA